MKYMHNLYVGWNRVRRISLRKKLLVGGFLTFAILLTIPLVTYAHFAGDIADRERLMNRNNTGFVLLDRKGEVIFSYGQIKYGEELSLSEISDHAENALLASEDKEFYRHEGYSPRGIAGALFANVKNNDLTRYGGSTITQQLVKNNLLTAERNFLRKYQELSMAIAVERRYGKQEIMEMYLNSVYFGEGAFGIGAAAKTYFNKSAQDLTLAESSMLIGLLPAPSAYSPISGDIKKAKERQKYVLDHMADAKFINTDEAEAAFKKRIKYQNLRTAKQKHAQHFAIMVLDELKQKYGEEAVMRGGYTITTTLDLDWQRQAEKYVRERVSELSSLGGKNAGLVAIDPKTGEIRALVGSVNWDNPKFGKVNVALTPRQPGSSFKPIFYTESMDKRLITPATILKDEPKTFGGTYSPQNYDFRFRGDIPVRRALALSLNIPAIEVMQKLGVNEAAQAAQRMGISTVTQPDKYGLSLALGTAEVKLLEITHAYAALANQGEQFGVSRITRIDDKFERTIYKNKPEAKRVMSSEASFLISSILSDQSARAATFGNTLLLDGGRKAAVKTGTTDKSRDAWTIGYTPSLAVGVWIGNNENKPMVGVAGSNGAAPIWRRSMASFLTNTPAEDFIKPKNIIEKEVCGTGFGSSVYREYFIKGSEENVKCEQQQILKPKVDKEDKKEPEKKEEEPDEKEENEDEPGGRGGGEPPEEDVETTPPAPDDGDSGGEGSTLPPPTDQTEPTEPTDSSAL